MKQIFRLLLLFPLLLGYCHTQTAPAQNVPKQSDSKLLQEAKVLSRKKEKPSGEHGLVLLNPKESRFLTAAGGERDPMQAVALLPGIRKSANGGEGYFVRGGSPDQNLMNIDEAHIYNPSHLLGFISAFNPGSVRDIKVYKGAFPAQYGGRLSSVMNIRLQQGDLKKWEGEAGLSLLSARMSVSGPLIPGKLSLALGARRSYIAEAFQLAGNPLPYRFSDIHAKLFYKIDPQQNISFTQFNGNDALDYAPGTKNNNAVDFGTQLRNSVSVFNYRNLQEKNIYNLSISHSGFNYAVKAGLDQNIFSLRSDISDIQIKGDRNILLQKNTQLKLGFEATNHKFNPNQTSIFGSIHELLRNFKSREYTSREAALFMQVDTRIQSRLQLQAGLRLSGSFGDNFLYLGPEPRLALSYSLNENRKISFAYNRMMQYMHLVSGSSAVMPTDLWFPVSAAVKPQSAHQLSLGLEQHFESIQSTLNIEPYFKTMQNLVEYKEGTQILLNNDIESDLLQGIGRAYGIEFSLQKKIGKLSGCMAYTLSWSERKFEQLNHGQWFYARYDRRHDFSLAANYEIHPKLILSGTFVWGSGMRVTPVVGKYAMPSGSLNEIITIPVYGDRNSLVLSPLHRLDLNLSYLGKWKGCALEWSLGAYNIYNRTQAFKVSMQSNAAGQIQFKQVGLYGFIPCLGLNLKF